MSVKNITFGALCLALAIVLPQMFHMVGFMQAGAVFLPMHIPTLLAGFVLGPIYGLLLGILSPIVSFFLTGMPSAERVGFMVCELAAYGFFSGLFFRTLQLNKQRFGTYFALALSLIAGRIAYAVALFIAATFLHVQGAGVAAIITAFITGLPGIAIQFLIIPPVVYAVEKSQFFYGQVRTQR